MKLLRTYRVLLTAVAVGALGAAVFGYSRHSDAQDKGEAKTPATPASTKAALSVSTVTPVTADWAQHLSANGSIFAWQEAVVGAEIGGLRITEVAVDVGDKVRKGQLLAQLQSETIAAEHEQTRASMAEADAALAEARANADRARQIEASGALSAQQIAQYLTAELTAKARVDVLKARLKSDELRLAQTRILAPNDGTITQRSATLGAVVQPGQELFRMNRRDRLEWRAELPAADLARIKPGMTATLQTANKSRVGGRVRMIAPTLDAQTRNGLVYVDLDAGDKGGASAGMFASGEIELGRGRVLTLPQAAVLMRDGYNYIYRLGSDNRVVQTKVSVGQRAGERVAITDGLAADAVVVATGVGFLADGDAVRVVAAPAAQPKQ